MSENRETGPFTVHPESVSTSTKTGEQKPVDPMKSFHERWKTQMGQKTGQKPSNEVPNDPTKDTREVAGVEPLNIKTKRPRIGF